MCGFRINRSRKMLSNDNANKVATIKVGKEWHKDRPLVQL